MEPGAKLYCKTDRILTLSKEYVNHAFPPVLRSVEPFVKTLVKAVGKTLVCDGKWCVGPEMGAGVCLFFSLPN